MAAFIHFVLVAAMIVPTFVLFVLHIVINLRKVNAKWKKNVEYRKRRKAGNNLRMYFNPQGLVVTEEVVQAHQLEAVERVFDSLRTLVEGHAFGNSLLYKYHASVKLAQEVAERCKQGVYNFLSLKKSDAQVLSSIPDVQLLLEELLERRPLSKDPIEVLNAFKGQLAVLHAVFSRSRRASGSWTYAGDAEKGVVEALLGTDQVGKKATSVTDFPTNPIPELTKQATKLLKSPWTKNKEKSSDGPPRPRFVEPLDMADKVHVRAGGLLFWSSEVRDCYGIGSHRLLLAFILTFLAVGPVRFFGKFAAPVVGVVLGLEILLEILRANEQGDFKGFVKKMLGSLHRMVLPIVLGAIILAALLTGGLNTPATVGEMEGKGTFLPLPPHYVAGLANLPARRFGQIPIEGTFRLANFFGDSTYIAIIYGIMHGNLWVLCLLPLPVCYGLQARFAARFPSLHWCVPQSPIWLHRILGYTLLGGILMPAMFWLAVQGSNCFLHQFSEPQLCDAFEPLAAAGKDVFVLRFHLVWPLSFCLVPLMIFDRHPDEADGKAEAPRRPAGPAHRPADEARGLLLAGKSEADVEGGAAAKPRPGEEPETLTLGQKTLKFLHRRIVEVCMVSIAGAGSVIAVLGSGSSKAIPLFVPVWPVILLAVLLHILTKFRSFVVTLAGPRLGFLDARGDEWSQLLRQSWWEVAYASHTIGFSVAIAFALWVRLQVFWPALFTWGLYFYDRGCGIAAAARNVAPIIVGEGTGSYAVSGGAESGKPQPSYVRLVLKRPEGFKYRAGQWAHLALPHCGAHFGAPGWLSPMQHWHAFSIASAEHEDELEFHIAVNGGKEPVVIEDGAPVTVFGHSEHFARLSRRGHLLEWMRPHVVPVIGEAPGLPACGASYTASSSGVLLGLTASDGSSMKVLWPQPQWTGRLWNTVQWLLQPAGKNSGGAAPPQAEIKIMGPYGTLPYACDAHQAVMLVGAGVGFPSTGSMLRAILEANANLPAGERKAVCFMWSATRVDQLLLCFPSLLVDLARYVKRHSLEDLKSWLTIKIFVSSFDAGDFLSVNPGKHLSPEDKGLDAALQSVREWLLGQDGEEHDEDGTYVCQGSLGGSFGDILRCSLFVKEHVVGQSKSLGICFCGPQDLCSWLRSEQANTHMPVKVQFHSECAG